MLDADILTNNTQWLPPMGILFLESSVHGSDYHHGTDDGLVRWCYILYPCTHLIFCPLLSLRNSFAAQSCLFILLLFIHLLSVWYLNVSDWYLHLTQNRIFVCQCDFVWFYKWSVFVWCQTHSFICCFYCFYCIVGLVFCVLLLYRARDVEWNEKVRKVRYMVVDFIF